MVSVLWCGTVAVADCHDGPANGDYVSHRWQREEHEWHASTDMVRMSLNTDNIDSNCVDVWFDWATAENHYDWRAIRVCKDNGYISTGAYYEPNTARSLIGWQKSVLCDYDKSDSAISNCSWLEGSPQACRNYPINPAFGSLGVRMWLLRSNGSADFSAGGSPMEPDA